MIKCVTKYVFKDNIRHVNKDIYVICRLGGPYSETL